MAENILTAGTMTRNLVLCFDGTSNKYAATNTNVVKTYAMLDRERTDQLSYYQPGIGTFAPPGVWGKIKRWIVTHLDLAIAWLLEEHVTDGYRFLMRYYKEGDQIFIFGFSRGAYTARAVAAMVHKVGLLTQGNEELIPFAWAIFKKEKDPAVYHGFSETFSRRVNIHFLGLWDTVSSVGWAWNPEHLQYTANNPSVEIVRHAVALDERRAYFLQNLWGRDPKLKTNIFEVWFPGVHCDVGGGYIEQEAGLSRIALRWLLNEAMRYGLRLNSDSRDKILPQANYVAASSDAMKHESLSGLWWILEYLPKRISDPAANFTTRWILHRGQPRHVQDGANIHVSVFDRQNIHAEYRPENIPDNYVRVEDPA
jgi:uncharacterized protein (DUF2235 family)